MRSMLSVRIALCVVVVVSLQQHPCFVEPFSSLSSSWLSPSRFRQSALWASHYTRLYYYHHHNTADATPPQDLLYDDARRTTSGGNQTLALCLEEEEEEHDDDEEEQEERARTTQPTTTNRNNNKEKRRYYRKGTTPIRESRLEIPTGKASWPNRQQQRNNYQNGRRRTTQRSVSSSSSSSYTPKRPSGKDRPPNRIPLSNGQSFVTPSAASAASSSRDERRQPPQSNNNQKNGQLRQWSSRQERGPKSAKRPHQQKRRKKRRNSSRRQRRTRPRTVAFQQISAFVQSARNAHEINNWMNQLAREYKQYGYLPIPTKPNNHHVDDDNDAKRVKKDNTAADVVSPLGLDPREEPVFVRLLGSRGAYQAVLVYLQYHLCTASVFCYTSAISVWSKNPHASPHVKKRHALDLIDDLETNRGVMPNSHILSTLFYFLSDDNDNDDNDNDDDDDKVTKLLRRLERDYPHVPINAVVYRAAIAACSRQRPFTTTKRTTTTTTAVANNSRKEPWQTALSLLGEMKQRGLVPDQATYTSLLNACAKAGQVRVAMALLNECIQQQQQQQQQQQNKKSGSMVVPHEAVWGAALNACAIGRDATRAMDILQTMQSSPYHQRPNTRHVSSFLLALARTGQYQTALDILEGMTNNMDPSPTDKRAVIEVKVPHNHNHNNQTTRLTLEPVPLNIIAMNNVVQACAQRGQYQAAKTLLDRMKNGEFLGIPLVPQGQQQQQQQQHRPRKLEPIQPNEETYNAVLLSCHKSKDAKDLIQEMRFSRRHRHGATPPSTRSYANAIAACRNDQDLDAALQLLQTAQNDGIEPNVNMYYHTLSIAERCQNVDVAVKLLDEMKEQQCRPNQLCYGAVIAVLATAGHVESAIALFQEMKKEQDLTISLRVYVRLAQAIRDCNDEVKSMSLLERIVDMMDASDLDTNVGGPVLEALILAYGMSERFDDALWVFSSINGPTNGPCLRAILSACSLANPPRWETALEILHTSDMVHGAMGPARMDTRALAFAVIACAKANQWREGLNILDLYGRPSMRPGVSFVPVAAINSLISACSRCGRPDMALRIFHNMEKDYKVSPDMTTYRSAAIACNEAQHKQRRWLEKGVQPQFDFTNDANGMQWWECALSLLRRRRENGIEPDALTYSAVICACEAAGEWQRALGVLDSMMKETAGSDDATRLNIYCFNGALSACEKGGAWVECLELYYRMLEQGGTIQPNVISLNCVLIALDKAGQKELAQSVFKDGVKNGVADIWKMTPDSKSGALIRAMDLHDYSAAMANAAVRSVLESLLDGTKRSEHDVREDLVIIVGKGKRSEFEPVLLPAVLELIEKEYNISGIVDSENSGRLILEASRLQKLQELRKWR